MAGGEGQNGSSTHFKTVQSFQADWCPSVFTQYESTRTGMRVVVVDNQGPKVSGAFSLATQVFGDYGTPHTLEHLIFMGSRSYKFKGLLDKLATRSFSDTNAWTEVDNTTYTLSSAGWDGFAQILPIYLEHLVLPTITDSACYTEVHHINGSGEDAGVVFSEMQATENTQSELMELKARRMMYPEGNGYRYETGGLMDVLRKLTVDEIRAYHKEMYQPKNLCLVIIGRVDHPNLLQILDNFENTIVNDVPSLQDKFDRPWTKGVRAPALKSTMKETVDFPEEDETMGQILIGFVGPDGLDKVLPTALAVFLTYICGSSISLLESTMVEKEKLCSAVYYSSDTRPDIAVWFTITGVKTTVLEAVEKRFFEVLKEAYEKPLDLQYLRDCLHRELRQVKLLAENSGTVFQEPIIYDHIYADREGKHFRDFERLDEYDMIDKWGQTEWHDFFGKYFIRPHHITVFGKPSQALAEKLEKEEKDRVEKRKQDLGETGLKELGKRLDAAKAENDKEIPDDLLRRFRTPTTESIRFIPTITARSGLARRMGSLTNDKQAKVDQDKSDLSTFIHFEHLPTNFANLRVFLGTHQIPEELRPLLPIFLMNFFETPIKRNGVRLDYEDVVNQLEKDTVGYSIGYAATISNPEMIRLAIQVETEGYGNAIDWIRDSMYHGVFEPERLESCFIKILLDIPEEKREGHAMMAAVQAMVGLTRASSVRAGSTLVKSKYLKRAFAHFKKDPMSIIKKLEQIRDILMRPSNIRVFVTANLDKLEKPVSSWERLVPPEKATDELAPLDSLRSTLSPAGLAPGNVAHVVPLKAIDSSYAQLTSIGPLSYNDPRLPAVAVAESYLNAIEGPLWLAVRGDGLAYGVWVGRDIDLGLLTLSIYRSPDAYQAFQACKKCITDLADGTVPINDLALEGAMSSIVVGFANEQPSMSSAATVSFVNQVVRGISRDWDKTFMEKVRAVTAEEVIQALREFVLPTFDPKKSGLSLTCAAAMEEKLVKGFKSAGFPVQVSDLASFEDDYGLEPIAGEDELMEELDDMEIEEDDDEDDEDDEESE